MTVIRVEPGRDIDPDFEYGRQTVRWPWLVHCNSNNDGPVTAVNAIANSGARLGEYYRFPWPMPGTNIVPVEELPDCFLKKYG